MGHVICIVSQKGGTGKTTTAVNIAASFALFEKNTLLIDCDPLGNSTTGLGVNKAGFTQNLFHALLGYAEFSAITIPTELEKLFIIPANYDLFTIETQASAHIESEGILQALVHDVANQYDYIVVDTPPSLGFLTVCSLGVADYIIIPTQRRIFSFEGLNQLLSLIQDVRSRTNPNLKIAGILFTMIERELCADFEKTPDFLSSLKGLIFKTIIPMDAALADASDYGKPGLLLDITAPGAKAYIKLAQEMHKIVTFNCKNRTPSQS